MGVMLDDSEIRRILVINAHPDDVDFTAAGTIALWTDAGIEVSYCIVTDGDAGGHDESLPRRLPVPDVRGLFYSVCLDLVGRLDLRVTEVRLTQHPMPVDGLVVGQSPMPPAKIHRAGEMTIQVWHPSAASAGPG